MKVRAVVVWFVRPIEIGMEVDPTGQRVQPVKRRNLEFDAVIPGEDFLKDRAAAGARWNNGCLVFTTTKAELLLVPREHIAWVELGPEREHAG